MPRLCLGALQAEAPVHAGNCWDTDLASAGASGLQLGHRQRLATSALATSLELGNRKGVSRDDAMGFLGLGSETPSRSGHESSTSSSFYDMQGYQAPQQPMGQPMPVYGQPMQQPMPMGMQPSPMLPTPMQMPQQPMGMQPGQPSPFGGVMSTLTNMVPAGATQQITGMLPPGAQSVVGQLQQNIPPGLIPGAAGARQMQMGNMMAQGQAAPAPPPAAAPAPDDKTGPIVAGIVTPIVLGFGGAGVYFLFCKKGPQTDLGGDSASEISDSDLEDSGITKS